MPLLEPPNPHIPTTQILAKRVFSHLVSVRFFVEPTNAPCTLYSESTRGLTNGAFDTIIARLGNRLCVEAWVK
jgi:hypothetical protein